MTNDPNGKTDLFSADYFSTSDENVALILEAQNICANGYRHAKLIGKNNKNEYIWEYEDIQFTYFEMFESLSEDPYNLG